MDAVLCKTCLTQLSGRKTAFCSRRCKNADTNRRHQSYLSQMKRGIERKSELVARFGGSCSACGYRKNLAALNWHHRVPSEKSFQLDLRALSNRGTAAIETEILKCDLLCANCHAEAHYPHLSLLAMEIG